MHGMNGKYQRNLGSDKGYFTMHGLKQVPTYSYDAVYEDRLRHISPRLYSEQLRCDRRRSSCVAGHGYKHNGEDKSDISS